MTADDLFDVDLTDDERRLLAAGLMEYGGPAQGAPVLAPLVGVASVAEFERMVDRLEAAVRKGEPLSDLDWARALVLTEISWASDLLGAGTEFSSNMSDEQAAPVLRSLQRKLVTAERIQLLLNNATRP
jgi:hypothetical protein